MDYTQMTALCGRDGFNCPLYLPMDNCNYLHPVADKASELPHNTKLFNLLLIKKMGVDAWAEKKAKGVLDLFL